MLTEMEGQPPLPDVTVDLILSEDGSVSGSSGCNRYTGEATFADGEMTLGPNLASTRMACEEAIMSQEDAYLRLLQQVAGYEVVDGQLHLTDADGNLLARFE